MISEFIPLLPTEAVTFDNSSALGVEMAPENTIQALETSVATLQAAREALQEAEEV